MQFQLNVISESYKLTKIWHCKLKSQENNFYHQNCRSCHDNELCNNMNEAPIKISLWAGAMPKELGLDIFDIIKEQYPEITPTVVYNAMSCPTVVDRHEITLDEDTARKSGKFGGACVREVIVPEGFMVKYLTEVFVPHYTNVTHTVKSFFGKIKQRAVSKVDYITVELAVDEEAFIRDWVNLGYPSKMGL